MTDPGLTAPPPVCTRLDPRPAAEAAACPIADAVNIPLDELAARTHELPPTTKVVQIVGPAALTEQSVTWLNTHGRRACAAADWSYAKGPVRPARLWLPNGFLETIVAEFPPGAALDLACGTGRDAVYLATRGWQVTAVDVLPDALERGRALAARYASGALPIRWLEADLERDPPAALGPFDLVVMVRYLHRPLLARLTDWLRPGGSFVCECFTTVHRARRGRPARPADVVEPGELRTLLAELTLRRYTEDWQGDRHTARAWAVAAQR